MAKKTKPKKRGRKVHRLSSIPTPSFPVPGPQNCFPGGATTFTATGPTVAGTAITQIHLCIGNNPPITIVPTINLANGTWSANFPTVNNIPPNTPCRIIIDGMDVNGPVRLGFEFTHVPPAPVANPPSVSFSAAYNAAAATIALSGTVTNPGQLSPPNQLTLSYDGGLTFATAVPLTSGALAFTTKAIASNSPGVILRAMDAFSYVDFSVPIGGVGPGTALGVASTNGTPMSSLTLNLTIPTGGGLVAVACFYDATVVDTFQCTDSTGGPFSFASATSNFLGTGLFQYQLGVLYRVFPAGPATITMSSSAKSTSCMMMSAELATGITNNAFDAATQNGANGTNSTPDSGAQGPTTVASSYVLGAIAMSTPPGSFVWQNGFAPCGQDVAQTIANTVYALTTASMLLTSKTSVDAALDLAAGTWAAQTPAFN